MQDLKQEENSVSNQEGGTVSLSVLSLCPCSRALSLPQHVGFSSLLLSVHLCPARLQWPYSSYYHPRSRSGGTEQLTHRENHGKVVMFQLNSWERDQIAWVLLPNHFCLLGVHPRTTPYPVSSGWATWCQSSE